jgi:predicted RNA polymerase sigma factor
VVGGAGASSPSGDAAEELAQETLVRVCERWPQVRTMSSPSGWTWGGLEIAADDSRVMVGDGARVDR